MLKIIIVSSLITVSFYSYSFASSNAIDGTIDEVAVLLDCFQKNVGNIYDDKEDFSINCDRWYSDTARQKNIDCSQSLLDKWFGSWQSTKTSLEKLAVPIPVCFKKGESKVGYISQKILVINKDIVSNSRGNFTLRSYTCRGGDPDICDNEDIRKERLKTVNDELNKKSRISNVRIEDKEYDTKVNSSDSKKVIFYR